MKTTRKNILKFFVLVIASVFVSQTLCFGVGNAFAQTSALAQSQYVSPQSAIEEINDVEDLVNYLNGEKKIGGIVKIKGGTGTKFDFNDASKDFVTTDLDGVTFDGNFCTILNLNKPLFGIVTGSNISNVYIGSGKIEFRSGGSKAYLGGIAQSINNSTINNCINNANIKLGVSSATASRRETYRYAGGIVGYSNNSTITNCSNHAHITSGIDGELLPWYSYAGGIVGFATGNTKIENCYVTSFNPTDTNNPVKIQAFALAKDDLANTKSSVISKNTSIHYTGLTHVLQKVNEDVNKWKKELTGYQEEVSGMNIAIQALKNSINDIEKTIQKHENQIASIQRTIQAKTREANNSFLGAAWLWIGPQILVLEAEILGLRIAQGAERVAQGALWASIGVIEAARAVVYAAITTVQTLLTGAAYMISYTVRDMNWLNVTDNATKYSYKAEAYAYGIGYLDSTNTKISNVYTYNINTTGGKRYAEYVLPLKFWSESEFLRGIYSSDGFKTTLRFVENNFYGPISNYVNKISVNDSYFFDSSYYLRDGSQNYLNNREIYISGKDDSGNYETGNWYGQEEVYREKHRVHVSIESQQLILSTSKSKTKLYKDKNLYVLQDIVLCVNNGREWSNGFFDDYAGYGTKFKTFKFYGSDNLSAFDAERPLMGTHSSYSSLNGGARETFVQSNLNEDVWGYQPSINNGFPYLKCRYWQEIE